MEAEDHDEQSITIKSVKARWNRFALPVIQGRQGECGWEYSTTGSDSSDDKQVKPRAAAEEAIRKYLTTFGKAAWGEIQAELQENGHTKSTVNRALKTMVSTMELVTWDEKYPSGKSCSFYQLDPKFQFQTES
jgi:hypothetical protein